MSRRKTILQKPLDTADKETLQLLQDLQGNIIKSHGRRYAEHIMLRFDPAKRGSICSWLRLDATKDKAGFRFLTSAHAELMDPNRENLFATFLLSAAGYKTLGLNDYMPQDPYFRHGMKADNAWTGPANTAVWENNYLGDIHGLIILAHRYKSVLAQESVKLIEKLEDLAEIVATETGQTLLLPPGKTTEKKHPSEHFGFRDGISQPVFIKQDVAGRKGRNWNPETAANVVLQDEGSRFACGSYMVFQKLEQNVAGFMDSAAKLAEELGLGSGAKGIDRVASLAVGREKDGRPLVESGRKGKSDNINDFDFFRDRAGQRCPFHAHIRKMNPRGETQVNYTQIRDKQLGKAYSKGIEDEKRMRIARRGISYGKRPDLESGSPLPFPEGDVGLLFMSYQAEIMQFLFHQWAANFNDYIRAGTGVDPIIGSADGNAAQRWPVEGDGDRKSVSFEISKFVTALGGEYFYAPSLTFLQKLPGLKKSPKPI